MLIGHGFIGDYLGDPTAYILPSLLIKDSPNYRLYWSNYPTLPTDFLIKVARENGVITDTTPTYAENYTIPAPPFPKVSIAVSRTDSVSNYDPLGGLTVNQFLVFTVGTTPKNKYWYFGDSIADLSKNDIGTERYWTSNGVIPDLLEQNFLTSFGNAQSDGMSNATASMSVFRSIAGTSNGTSTARIVLNVDGIVNPEGKQDFWYFGESFVGLKCDTNASDASDLIGAIDIWTNVGTEEYIMGTFPPPQGPGSTFRNEQPGIRTKRSKTGSRKYFIYAGIIVD